MVGLINGEVVDMSKEYEMLKKLNLVDEKVANLFDDSGQEENIDVRNIIS